MNERTIEWKGMKEWYLKKVGAIVISTALKHSKRECIKLYWKKINCLSCYFLCMSLFLLLYRIFLIIIFWLLYSNVYLFSLSYFIEILSVNFFDNLSRYKSWKFQQNVALHDKWRTYSGKKYISRSALYEILLLHVRHFWNRRCSIFEYNV